MAQIVQYYPTNQPASYRVGGAGNEQPGFYTDNTLTFVLPPSQFVLKQAVISGVWVLAAPGNGYTELSAADMQEIGISPATGDLGLFSNERISRAYSDNPIEAYPQSYYNKAFKTYTDHDEEFLTRSGGLGLFPFWKDISNRPYSGLVDSKTLELPTDERISLCSPYKSFAYQPAFGLLVSATPKPMMTVGGLRFDLQVGTFNQVFNTLFPAPSEDVPAQYNAWMGKYQQVYNGNILIKILNPIMTVLYETSSNQPTGISIEYQNIQFTRQQMTVSQLQSFAINISQETVQALDLFVVDKRNILSQEYNALATDATRTFNCMLQVGGVIQFYAVDTAFQTLNTSFSVQVTNPVITAVRTQPALFSKYADIFNGAYVTYPYDPYGNGVLFNSANVTYNWTFNYFPESEYPFNDNYGQDNFAVRALRVNQSTAGITPLLSTALTPTAGFQAAPFNTQVSLLSFGVTPAQILIRNLRSVQAMQTASIFPDWKYTAYTNPGTNADVFVVRRCTATIMVNEDASVIVPVADTAKPFPEFLIFNQAGPPAQVTSVRVLIQTVNVTPNPPRNTIGLEYLLPDTGILSGLILRVPLRPINWEPLKMGFSKFKLGDWNNNTPVDDPEAWPDTVLGHEATTLSNITAKIAQRAVDTPVVYFSIKSRYVVHSQYSRKPPQYVNWLVNRTGYDCLLGDACLFRQLEWVLPGGVTIQRYTVQEGNFLNRYAIDTQSNLTQTMHTHHISNGWFVDQCHDGKVRDILLNRDRNSAFEMDQSVWTCYHSTNPLLSDWAAGTQYSLVINLRHVDPTIAQMEGVPLISNAKRFLRMFIDTRHVSFANCPSGAGCGFSTEGDVLQTTMSHFSMADNTPANLKNFNAGTPRRMRLGMELDPDIPVTMMVQLAFYTPNEMNNIYTQFREKGVMFDVQEWLHFPYYQTNILDFKTGFAFPNGRANSWSVPQEIIIGGKDIQLVLFTHTPVLIAQDGDENLFPLSAPEAYSVDVINNWGNRGNIGGYSDLYKVPYYAACRNGINGYSFPCGIIHPSKISSNNLSSTPSLNILFDNQVLWPFNLGTNWMNQIMNGIAFHHPVLSPDWMTEYNTPRRYITYDRIPFLRTQITSVDGNEHTPALNDTLTNIANNVGGQPWWNWFGTWGDGPATTYPFTQTTIAAFDAAAVPYNQTNFSLLNQAPLIPTRFVTALPILPKFRYANQMLVTQLTNFDLCPFNWLGTPSQENTPTILEGLTASQVGSSLPRILASNLMNVQQMCRHVWCMQTYKVWFNMDQALIKFNYDSGQTISS